MNILEKYKEWVAINDPDNISRNVFFNFLKKYYEGEKEPLFDLMISFEQKGFFKLCSKLKSLFEYFEINKTYIYYKYTGFL